MTEKYNCPICGAEGQFSPRYPKCICVECGKRAVDETGRKVRFTNESFSGGYLAYFRDTDEPYPDHVCWVDGIKCWADEAHMGGIVVSIYDAKFNKER